MSDAVTHTFIFMAVVLSIILAAALRIANESERFVVFTLGRFSGVKGPGLLFKPPGPGQTWVRVRIGDLGELVGPAQMRIQENDIPIVVEGKARLGTMVRIVGYEDDQVKVVADPTARHKCPKCGHEFIAKDA